MPKGFSTMTRDQPPAGDLLRPASLRLFRMPSNSAGGDGKIEEPVALGAALGVDLLQALGQAGVALGIAELAAVVVDALGEALPELVLDVLAGELAGGFLELGAELLIGLFPAGEADDGEGRGQIAIGGQVIKRGDELAVGEIARGAEDDDGARLRHAPAGKAFAQGIYRVLFSSGWCQNRAERGQKARRSSMQ